jgi:undecaprenol kinase
MKTKRHRFLKSFLYAFHGIAACISERNMRFHLSAAVVVTAFSLVYRLDAMGYGLLFFAIGLVLAAECINTAVEHTIDLVSPDYHPLAGKAKDAAAGGVLIAAITAVAIGLVLFFHLPRLTDTLLLIATSWRLPVFLALIAGGGWFTFGWKRED